MAVRRTLHRLVAVVAASTAVLAAGPLVGAALAAPPVLAANGLSPADGSSVQPPATVSACFTGTLFAASAITVTKASLPVAGASSLGSCNGGTNNKLIWTPTSALTNGLHSVSATAMTSVAPGDSVTIPWSFTVDTTPPTTPNTLTLTNPVTSANVTAVAVTGKTDASTAVSVVIANNPTTGNTATKSGTSDGSGNFSLTGIDVSALADGAIRATVTATDAAGNTSSATVDASKDVTAPNRLSTVPANGARVQPRTTVTVTFSEAVNPAASSITVKDVFNGTLGQAGGSPAWTVGNTVVTFTAASTMTQAGSPYTVTTTATDTVGNAATTSTTFIVDSTAPAAPSVTLTNPINAANQASATVSGTAEPGSTVNVSVDDTVVGSPVTGSGAAAPVTGAYSIPVDLTSLADGAIVATATATDEAGNTGSAGTSGASVKDTAPPGTPTVEMDDPITNAGKTTVHISGIAAAGSAIGVSVDDATPGSPVTTTTTAHPSTGAYSVTMDLTALADGTVTASVVATDAAGNPSTAGTDTATTDTGVPGTPTLSVEDPVNAANVTTVTLSGVAEASSTVHLSLSDGTNTPLTHSVTANGTTGAYTWDFDASSLDDGTLTATATAEDAVGNESAAATDTATKDTALPGNPVLNLPAFVNNATKSAVDVTGTAEPGSTVTIVISDTDGGTTSVTVVTVTAPNGTFSTTANVTSQTDGVLTGSATAVDAVGNQSSGAGTDTTTKDVAAPNTPTVSMTDPINPGNVASVTVGGVAESGATVNISVDDTDAGTTPITGSTTAASNAYSVGFNLTPLTDGTITATVTATDPAGNVSSAGTDTAPKDTLTLARTSTSPVDGTTVMPPATISATYNEPLKQSTSTIVVTNQAASQLAGNTTFTNGGKTIVFTPTGTLSDAGSPYTVTLSTHDDAGDASATTFEFTVDGTPPGTPSVTLPDVNLANVAAVSVTGVAEPSSSVTVSVDDSVAGSPVTDTVSADGTTGEYTATLNLSSLLDGTITASVVATDAPGNASPAGTDTAAKDTAAPTQPTVSMPDYVNNTTKSAITISGVTSPSASVAVSVDDTVAGSPVTDTVTADGTTGAYTTTLDLSGLLDGALTATVVATDGAGNASSPGTDSSVKDTVAPAAPTVSLTDPVNAANAAATPLSGTAEVCSEIAYDVTGTSGIVSGTATADCSTGEWSDTPDLSALPDGALSVAAYATDAAGNTSGAGTDTAAKDTVVPTAPSANLTDPVNAGNVTAVVVSGVAEPSGTVHVSLDDATVGSPLTADVVADGTTGAYTKTFDATSLADGTLTATVTVTDAGGNTSTAGTDTATKDVVAPAAPTIDTPAAVTHQTYTAAPFSGTAVAGTTVTVAIDDANSGTAPVLGTTTATGGGTWSLTIDLTTLDDGTLSLSVTAADAAGNTGPEATSTVAKNVTRAFTIAVSSTPVSGDGQSVTVTAHQTSDPLSPTDTTYVAAPALSSGDTHFTGGSCGAAVAGVASCTGTVFGDLGAQTLTAGSGSGASLVTGTANVTVQPTALTFGTAPAAKVLPGVPMTFTVVPVAGVSGAVITGYNRTRTLVVTGGGSSPATGSALTCPSATCSVTVTFSTRGAKTVKVTDNGTPSRSTPTAAVSVPYASQITLLRSKLVTPAGGSVTLSGTLRNISLGTAIAGAPVKLYRRAAGTTTYTLAATVTTTSTGAWSQAVNLSRNTSYEVRYAGDLTHAAVNSTARTVNAAQIVTSAWSLSARTLTVTGVISPSGARGRPVYLYLRRSDGTWYVIKQSTVDSTNRYRIARPLGPGTYTMRVVVAATTLNVAGTGPSRTITVT